MGVAVAPGRLACCARSLVWILAAMRRPSPLSSISAGNARRLLMTRAALFTGAINSDELAWRA